MAYALCVHRLCVALAPLLRAVTGVLVLEIDADVWTSVVLCRRSDHQTIWIVDWKRGCVVKRDRGLGLEEIGGEGRREEVEVRA